MSVLSHLLTEREQLIAKLCSQGKVNRDIASALGITVRTVETHKQHIYQKLGINSIVGLMCYVAEHKSEFDKANL